MRHAQRRAVMSDGSETFFIRFLMIDTTSDQDLGSIAQKLCPTDRVQKVALLEHVYVPKGPHIPFFYKNICFL